MTRVGANLLLAGESFENFHYANFCRFATYCNTVPPTRRNVPANALDTDKLRSTPPKRRYVVGWSMQSLVDSSRAGWPWVSLPCY